jgi:hypothetical protein
VFHLRKRKLHLLKELKHLLKELKLPVPRRKRQGKRKRMADIKSPATNR